MNALGLQSFRLKNFKAVRDSGVINFTPLTVFIGGNGSGKSSIIEGLEMLHIIATEDLDHALQAWRGFEHIANKGISHELLIEADADTRPYYRNAMSFLLTGRLENKADISYMIEIAEGQERNEVFIRQEKLSQRGRNIPYFDFTRNDSSRVTGRYMVDKRRTNLKETLPEAISLLNLRAARLYDIPAKNFIQNWQFVSLVPQKMGEPIPQRLAGGRVKLEKDGSNIAEYLLDIRKISPIAFEDIVTTLQQVLPYSQDLQIAFTSELEHTVYLQLTEGGFKVPGWLLSGGTLRIVALLALLRHPEPPPLIIIEEIENGLDPSSIHLIVDEIRNAVEKGRTQVIATTHSPYLLDQLLLSHIVLVQRINGEPTFSRPADKETLQKWADKLGVGGLYTTGELYNVD